jgi:hypothetical protein
MPSGIEKFHWEDGQICPLQEQNQKSLKIRRFSRCLAPVCLDDASDLVEILVDVEHGCGGCAHKVSRPYS